MKKCKFKRILPLILSVALLFSMCFEIIMSVLALDNIHTALFSYGNYIGVNSAVGTNPDDIKITSNKITLPDNKNAINLYWSNGKKLYKAGSVVSISDLVEDNNGNYQFTAIFGSFSLDYDEIDTDPFTFYTDGGTQISNDGFFSHLNKNSWWHIPDGYANDGKNTAFGASSFAIKKRSGTNQTGNYLYLKPWEGGEYKNALFFTHSPFDSNDPNSHNSNASGTVNYKYAYFTPGEEYTLSFDYMIDNSAGGSAPYTASIAFGMDTATSNANCGGKTIEYANGSVTRTNVDLGTQGGVWKRTSVTIKAPESYTGNGITSARMGFSCNIKAAGGCYIDNIDVQYAGTKITFKYEDVDGSSSVFGNSMSAYADEDGNFTVPKNDSAINLLWKHGNTLYEPGTNLNIEDFGDNLTFTAFFGGANLDYENIYTGNVSLVNGTQSQNLYEALSRNADYWTVPAGLSNIAANKSGRYGLALGHDRMAIVPNVGKTGKGLRLRTNVNGPHNLYRSAALFSHSPSSFDSNSYITYSYVYYNTNTEYTLEFDYKTVSEVSATIAFGVNTTSEFDSSVQSVTVNSNTFTTDGKYITLPATGDEWKHASITIKSPSSYVGNGVTSGRVGIAIKDNEENGNSIRYNYFDNISFYPTTMKKDTVRIITGFENTEEDSKIISYFKAKEPLKVNSTIVLPEGNTIRAGVRKGVNSSNVAWSAGHGHVSNLVGWQLLDSGKIYPLTEKTLLQDLPENAVFSAVYGDASINFNNLTNDFKFFNNGNTSYGYMSGKIEGDSNKYVNLTGGESQNNSRAQVLLFSDEDNFLAYNTGKTYKVTFKYRRTDNVDVESKLFFNFGAIPWSWRAESGGVSRIDIGLTKKGMTEFETITVFVTAPNTYLYSTGGNNPEYFYSKSMAVGATLSNGVSVDIDDISISLFEPDKKDVNVATFEYGSSKDFNDTKTVEFTDIIYLPIKQNPRASRRTGTNSMGQDWYVDHGQISNHTSWYCTNNNTYYDLGAEVSVDEVGKNPKFIAMYEGGEVNFDNIDANLQFFNNGNTSYGYMSGKIEGDSNKYVNLTGGESQNNSRAQVLLFSDEDNFLAYNTGKTYKVTFKYRRTDNVDVESKLFFNFGAIPWSWRAESGGVSRIEIGSAKKGMTEFETITVYVTAPDTYLYNTGGEHPEYFYSRSMAVGATLSNGVSVDIDDVVVEPIGRDEVTLTFAVPANNTQTVVIGKIGNKINIPSIDVGRNNVIEGWYIDNNFKEAFTLKTFPKTNMTVYAKLEDAKVRYYGFVDYPWDTSVDEDGQYARTEKHVIEKGLSSDGDGYALKIVNTDSNASDEQLSIALPVGVKPNTKYLISYDFYYEDIGDKASAYSQVWFNTSVTAKAWKGVIQNITSTDEYTPANLKEKKWYTGYVFGTTSEFDWSNRLVLMVRVPVGSIRYIDNIVVTEISEDENVVLWKLGSFQSPEPTIAKKNSTIKLPKAKLEGNYVFLNWVLENQDYTEESYLVEEDTIFTAKTTTNKFDEGFENTYYGKHGITTYGMDLDWEIYDSNNGSKENVKNGRYSLHRIGKDIRNTAYCIHHNSFVTEYTMAEGQIYTVSFWAMIENPVHKLGSIDIASCISLGNPWDFASDRFKVASIEDIADGEWHKLTYTFIASGPYLSIVVPGNLSIYIDDVTVQYTPDAEKSENCEFEEYIPAPLTSDGKYVKPTFEDDGLERFQLVKRTDVTPSEESGINVLLFVIIGAVAVLLIGATITILLIRRKKVRR